MRNFAVYSVLTGSYENLNEELPKKFPNTRFICFTDNRELRSDNWDIKVIESKENLSPHKLSRRLKMQPWSYISDIDELLYIDNTVTLTKDPILFYDALINDTDMGFVSHSFHMTMYEEMYSIIDNNLVFHEEIIHWASLAPTFESNYFDMKPIWGGIIARRKSQLSLDFGKEWWFEYLRSPARDQLTLAIVASRFHKNVNISHFDNQKSPYHFWPNRLRESRKPRTSFQGKSDSLSKLKILNSFLSTSAIQANNHRMVLRAQASSGKNRHIMGRIISPLVRFFNVHNFRRRKIRKFGQFIYVHLRSNPRTFILRIIRNPLKAFKSAIRIIKSGI